MRKVFIATILVIIVMLIFQGCSAVMPMSRTETIKNLQWKDVGKYSIPDEESWQTFSYSNEYSNIVFEIGEPWGPHHMVSIYSREDVVRDDNLAMPYHAHGCPWNVIACLPTKQIVSEIRITPVRNTSLLMRLDISNLLIVDKGKDCPARYESGIVKISVCQVNGEIWSWVYEHPIFCSGEDT